MPIAVAVIGAAVPIAAGAFVARRDGRHPVGWLLVAHGVAFAVVLGIGGPHTDGVGLIADQLLAGAWALLFVGVALAVYLVPDGQPVNTFWRRWLTAGCGGVVLLLAGAPGDRSGFTALHDGAQPPVPWLPETLSAVLGVTGVVGVAALLVGAVASARVRLRRSIGAERQQMLWVLAGAVPIPIAVIMGWIDHFLAGGELTLLFDLALLLASVALPVSIAVAILRHQSFDIRVVLSHVVTSVALGVFVATVYVLGWFASGMVVDGASRGLAATAVLVLIAHPVAVTVHRRVERWVHGYGSAPYLAVRRVAVRTGAVDVDRLVDEVLRSVAEAVGADQVRLEFDGPQGDAMRVPIGVGGEQLGVMAVELPPDRSGAVDRALLEDIGRYVALVVRSEQLNSELRASHVHLLESRTQERKRLHRELHDGLGPTLAAIVLKLDVARRRSEADRDSILDEVQIDARNAVAEVRRVVEGLRPTVLEEAGLIEALRTRARSLTTDITRFSVDATTMPAVPIAVEDAAYRIASEAMTNAAKHSNARHCRVHVVVGDALSIVVADDGDGAAPHSRPGGGWRTMVERATELGGTCTVALGKDGGTEVSATLPLEPRHEKVRSS